MCSPIIRNPTRWGSMAWAKDVALLAFTLAHASFLGSSDACVLGLSKKVHGTLSWGQIQSTFEFAPGGYSSTSFLVQRLDARELDTLSVVGECHVGGQGRIGGLMIQFVRNVRKQHSLRSRSHSRFDGLI